MLSAGQIHRRIRAAYKLVAQSLSDAAKDFKREVGKELTGRESESWEIVCSRMANLEGNSEGDYEESRSHGWPRLRRELDHAKRMAVDPPSG
jgi:hypothetical protein